MRYLFARIGDHTVIFSERWNEVREWVAGPLDWGKSNRELVASYKAIKKPVAGGEESEVDDAKSWSAALWIETLRIETRQFECCL